MALRNIITRIYGGLGNQLFAYAAARRLALVNNAELVIDDVSGFTHDHAYERHYQLDHFNIPCRKATPAERMEPFGRYRRFLKRKFSMQRPFFQRHYLAQEAFDFDQRLLEYKVDGTLYLEGYWQSENYFKDVETTIRTDLCIQPPSDAQNLQIASRIHDSMAVAVHVRFFDAPIEHGGSNAPQDYYSRAVARMEALAPGAHYFVFSDQPDATHKQMMLSDERITVISHNQGDENAYADLWLMMQCKHFIIANSTFSWWGAWLGSNAKSIVIAPGFELREGVAWWGFDGLLPDRWIKI